jgi:hypothetical protein
VDEESPVSDGFLGSGGGGNGVPWSGLEHRRWSARFVVVFTLGGLGSAVVAYLGILASWNSCGNEFEPGGGLFVNFLGIAGLFVMPLVAAVSAGLAAGAHSLLLRSTRLRKFSDVVPSIITVTGIIALIALIVLWIAAGNPPTGYCDPIPG